MNDIVNAYIDFLLNFKELQRPLMPKFNKFAYTENEYLEVINLLDVDYNGVDDLQATIDFLKGR